MAEFEGKITTGAMEREKAAAALGTNQRSAFDIVHREDYKTEAEYIQALAATSKALETPEYQKAARKAAEDQIRRNEAEIRKAQRAEFQEIRKGITLQPYQREQIDKQAAEMARADLAAGKIGTADMGKTIEQHAKALQDRETDAQAAAQQFNSFLRGMVRGSAV